MKILKLMKDGGPESKVSGLYFIEIKKLFTIVLLHFSNGTRDAYHNHAFNAISWLLRGRLRENPLGGSDKVYKPSLKPIVTPKSMFHQVASSGDTWVLSFRGPWSNTWKEYLPEQSKFITLTHGRQVIE
jgi:predicted metal-dependent enzyme (double-stranded beta helix superfamily)